MSKTIQQLILFLTGMLFILLNFGCYGGSEVIGKGGSEVIGTLVTEDNKPVKNATVRAIYVDVNETSETVVYDSTEVLTVDSDKNGTFSLSFEDLEIREYVLDARKGDSLIIKPQLFTPNRDSVTDLETIIMVEPGAVKGIVKAVGGDSTLLIDCQIPGISVSGAADPVTGSFLLSGLFPDTVYTIALNAPCYIPQFITEIPITAGETYELEDTVFLQYDPDCEPPIVENVQTRYDTASGTLTVEWTAVQVEDVSQYIVRYSFGGTTVFDTVSGTIARRIISTIEETEVKQLTVQVAALDNDFNPGQWNSVDSLSLPPPSWVRINTVISAGRRSGDTVYVICSYLSQLRKAVSLKWYTDESESMFETQIIENASSGSDTLIWLTTTDARTLYVAVTDENDSVWVDSVDARSLLPINTWEEAASMSVKRRYCGACVINGKIYVFGGCQETMTMMMDITTLDGLNSAEVYDPVEKTWTSIASMNAKRFNAAAAVVDNKIYVFGGMKNTASNNTTIERYDPETDTWEIIDTMDHELIGAAACSFNGRILVSGGAVGKVDNFLMLSDTIRYYDPSEREWSSAGILSEPRLSHKTVIVDSKVMMFGGVKYDSDGLMTMATSIECLSLNSNAACLPSFMLSDFLFGFGAAVIGNNLIVLGGMNSVEVGQLPIADVTVISLETGFNINGKRMPVALEGFSTVVLNDRIYVIGGSTREDTDQKSSSSVYIFYP